MRFRRLGAAALAVTGWTLFAGGCDYDDNNTGMYGAEDDESEVSMTLDEMPEPVRDAILALTTEANITQLSRETEDGRMVYEVEYTANGVATEAEFDAQGNVLDQGDDDDGGADDDDGEDDDM